jgi:hypothetical protein
MPVCLGVPVQCRHAVTRVAHLGFEGRTAALSVHADFMPALKGYQDTTAAHRL